MAVINAGTCSSYGGIPGAKPNPTGIKPVAEILKEDGISTPVVNVPGCPPHPDWFVGTVATILIGGLEALDVDSLGRPKAFYGKLLHDNCQYRGSFDKGVFAKDFSEEGCLYQLGCKGPVTNADCSHRKWNNGTNWCIGSGSPCIGCVEPEFPYQGSMLARVNIHGVTPPDTYPPIYGKKDTGVTTGLVGVTGAAIGLAAGIGLASARKKKHSNEDEKQPVKEEE
jgi:hydrogenase small subunit